MVSFTCGGTRYCSFDFFFFFFTTFCFLPCLFVLLLNEDVKCFKFHYLLSGDLKYSVLAHAHVLQKLVMNVNNAKAIKIILDSIRSNAIPCPLGCFVGVRNQCQTSEMSNFTSPTSSHV